MDVCPMLCINPAPKEGFPDMLFIQPMECIDCGLCVAECPVEAIYAEDEVPDEWHSYIALNAEVYQPAA
jgi:ferredoxin